MYLSSRQFSGKPDNTKVVAEAKFLNQSLLPELVGARTRTFSLTTMSR